MKDRIARLIRHLTPSGTVVQQTAKSGIWRLATNVSSRSLQLLMLIILARLLEPRHFGLMGIALVTLSATRKFTDIGLNAALIQQHRDNVDDYLDTTWCLEIARGVLILTVLYLLAPVIAGAFGEPEATLPIQIIALGPLLVGLQNPGVVYFYKHLEFHKDFTYRASGGLVQLIVGVSYALVSPTVWALVFAFLARDAVELILSYFLHPYRPWPRFDFAAASELIHYGKWITGSSMIQFLYSEGDDAFVGWYLTATALGFYQYAYRLADAPSTEVSEVIAQVMFPTFAKLQGDVAALREALLQTLRLTGFVTFPMAFGIALVAPSFVPAILGPEWTPMIPVLQLLALYGLLHAITRNFGSLWKAIDRPDLTAKLPLVGLVGIAICIWPMTARWGIVGTALAVILPSLVVLFPLNVYVTATLVECKTWDIYREYAYPFVAASAMFGILWYARLVLSLPALVEFLLLIPAGAAIYLGVALLLERRFGWGIEENLRTVLEGITS